MGVDAQRERRVGVSELLHDGRRIDTADEENRRERVAQLVGGDALGQRLLAALLEQLVGAADDRPDDAFAGVVLVAAGTGRGREDEVLGPGGGVRVPVRGELVAQRREDVDLSDSRVGLGGADGDVTPGEVDVAPAQRRGLADTEAGEDQRRDQGTAAGGAGLGRGIKLGRGVQERDDLFGLSR